MTFNNQNHILFLITFTAKKMMLFVFLFFIYLVKCYDYDVIIMGAGMAGLSALKRLKELGINNVLILDAQDYIGGRVKTVIFNNHTLNAGASWIQGVCTNNCDSDGNNPLYSYANKIGLQYYDMDWDDLLVLNNDATIVDDNIMDPIFEAWDNAEKCIDNDLSRNRFYYETNNNYLLNYRFGLQLCNWNKATTSIRYDIC